MGAPLDSPLVRTAPVAYAGRSVVALVAALLLLGVGAAGALAHAELDTSDPADGTVLDASPATITLTFTETLDPAKSSFKVSGADGAAIGTGAVTGAKVMTLDGLTLGPGAYLVKWTSASAEDGDIARGELTFSVAAAASPSVTPTQSDVPSSEATSAAPPPSTAPTPVASVAPTPAPSAAPASPASSTGDVLLPIIVGLLIVAGVGAYVLRRNRAA